MTPYKHAESSASKWGGCPEDYILIHDWFDETKQYTGDFTHRALRHHSAGVQWCIEKFGHSLTNSSNRNIPVKLIAEQHVFEDCGYIPTPQAWLKPVAENPQRWMLKVQTKNVTPLLTVEEKEKV
ncbi:MAG: hypothetical protein HN472_14620 [Nitrospina sp.]|jgi:hypothetical protein|nr:hypothetical protein [Nitrospina sp.]MBT5638472.1 hypothetical protein [Candidatus Peribacter sp.]